MEIMMKKTDRIEQLRISDAIAKSIAVETQRISDLQDNQVAEVNGATAANFVLKSAVGSIFGDSEDITTAGMYPKSDLPDLR
jgi:hypothetical protein